MAGLVEDTVDDKRAPDLISAVLRYGTLERGEAQIVLKTSERTTEIGRATARDHCRRIDPAGPG